MTPDFDAWSVLSAHQTAVARRFLAKRDRERRHLVVHLSGSLAYGPAPDEDLVLDCVHLTPTRELVGLTPDSDFALKGIERNYFAEHIEQVEDVEVRYGSTELAPVVRGVIKGDGFFVERILGDRALAGDAKLLAETRTVVRQLLSRRVARHYGLFASAQLRLFDEKPTAEHALYLLLTCATGRHLLAHGDVVTEVARLSAFMPSEIEELLAIKLRTEGRRSQAELISTWRPRLEEAIAAVDAASAVSILPMDPPAAALAAADGWLQAVRRASQ
jgi:hypothetical protein